MIDIEATVAKAESFDTVKEARQWIVTIINDLVELKRYSKGLYKNLIRRIVEPFHKRGKTEFFKEIETYVKTAEWQQYQSKFDEATNDAQREQFDTNDDGIVIANQDNMVRLFGNNKFIEFNYETFSDRKIFRFLDGPLWSDGLEKDYLEIKYPVEHKVTKMKVNRWYYVAGHMAELKLYLHRFFPAERSWFELEAAIEVVTKRNLFNLYQDWMDNGLPEWDSEDHFDILYRYAGVEDREWAIVICKLIFLGLVARCYEPGFDFRGNVILEGPENIGKTWLTKAIGFQGERFYTGFEFNKYSNDFEPARILKGNVVIELADKGGMDNKTADQVKAFLTRTHDVNRRMNHDDVEHIKRIGIMIITCNESDGYLKGGATGDTRFYPVRCNGRINVEAIIAELPQLYAQAKHMWEIGLTPRPTEHEMELQQKYIASRQIKPTYYYYILETLKLHRTQVGNDDKMTGGFTIDEMLGWMESEAWFILKSKTQHRKEIAKVLRSNFPFKNDPERVYTDSGMRSDSKVIRRWRYVNAGMTFDDYIDSLED